MWSGVCLKIIKKLFELDFSKFSFIVFPVVMSNKIDDNDKMSHISMTG